MYGIYRIYILAELQLNFHDIIVPVTDGPKILLHLSWHFYHHLYIYHVCVSVFLSSFVYLSCLCVCVFIIICIFIMFVCLCFYHHLYIYHVCVSVFLSSFVYLSCLCVCVFIIICIFIMFVCLCFYHHLYIYHVCVSVFLSSFVYLSCLCVCVCMCVMNVSVQDNKLFYIYSLVVFFNRQSTPINPQIMPNTSITYNTWLMRSYCCHSVTLFRILAKQHLLKHILLQLQYN